MPMPHRKHRSRAFPLLQMALQIGIHRHTRVPIMNSVTPDSTLKIMRPLSGKVALVTGSTSGIGLAVLEKLAAEGADVVMNGFGDPTAIEAVRSELEGRYSVRIRYDGADMRKPEA